MRTMLIMPNSEVSPQFLKDCIDTGYGSTYKDGEMDEMDGEDDESDASESLSRDGDDDDGSDVEDGCSDEDVDDEDDVTQEVSKKMSKDVGSVKKRKKVVMRGNSAGNPLVRKMPSMRNHQRKNKKVPGSVRKPTNDKVVLMKSNIKGKPDAVFFSYPGYVGKAKESSLALKECTQEQLGSKQLIFKIAESTNIYNSVVNSCKNAGMYLVDSGKDWNLLFTGYIRSEALREVNKYQRINHFPGSYELGRKDRMWKNISRMKRKFGVDYNI